MGKYITNCLRCGIEKIYNRINRIPKYCSRNCQNLHAKETGKFKGENNPSFGKKYRSKETHPEWANLISETHKKNQVNVGEKNGMKKPEVAERMSKTRREKVTSNPEYKNFHSKRMINLWKEGKYDNCNVGICKWYDFIKKDGTLCKVQGKWELAYVKYLNDNDIPFFSHKGRISYFDENENVRNYYPDFYLINENIYVDIKNDYHFSLQIEKFNLIKKHNPEIEIKILNKKHLLELGIKI
jgi:hypothetical protein